MKRILMGMTVLVVLVGLTGWADYDKPSGPVTLHMELPNRHMNEAIHETLVTPPSGGVDITIE